MADKKFMGTFNNETEVLRKIEELRGQGKSEQDMYVLVRNENQASMIRGQTDVDYTSADGDWKDKFKEFLSGSEDIRNALSDMGVSKEEADSFYEEVEDGRLLLFVDTEIGTGAQERGFNSMAAYGDPKDDPSRPVEQDMSAEIGGDNSPFSTDAEGNVTTGDGEEAAGEGIYTGQRTDDLAAPDANLTDVAETGRNRRDVPMMDRQIEDVPVNDPNAEDAGPVKTGADTEDVRRTNSVSDDLSGIDVSDGGLPANDQAPSDVPPADPDINDVPDADRSLDRLSDTESPEHWTQNAADRVRRNDSNEKK